MRQINFLTIVIMVILGIAALIVSAFTLRWDQALIGLLCFLIAYAFYKYPEPDDY